MAAVNVKEDDIYLILKNLYPEKADGWDNILIRMIRLWGEAIKELLRILFLSFLEERVHPDGRKKSNVVLIHKKESKVLIKNYRPISLLSVFSKVSERIFFNSLFNYFIENKLFTECQSGSLSSHSCISELQIFLFYLLSGCNMNLFRHLKSLWQSLAWWFNLQTQFIWCRKQTSKPNWELFDKPLTTCSTQWSNNKMD